MIYQFINQTKLTNIIIDEYPKKEVKEVVPDTNLTYGDRLYHKDLALRALYGYKTDRLKQKLIEDEKLNETHTPKISNTSTQMNNKVNLLLYILNSQVLKIVMMTR